MSSKIFNSFKIFALATGLLVANNASVAVAADEKPIHWLKRCVTDENSIRTCLVTEAIILENKAQNVKIQLASIRIQSMSNSRRQNMYIQVPNKILLQSGLRFQIDKGKTRVAPFSICYDQACESEINLSTDFINQLKKGNEISLYFLQFDGKPVTIRVPLIGFTAGYNSKGDELTREEAGLPPVAAKPAAAEGDAPKPLPE